ncbi:transporter substrate-binding domain-containing protein [Agrobacterium vitis]|uniref:transporter substrate-binding domain-containing protein n=1 Tax=Rhizobium/Agrobacterium group TaxID=227290 RepID=UPI0012E730A9|nr:MULTISPECIES: transporter substrate-binding domain-containing protein [Rhizobium/Agrobacterium group]MCF1495730.1 transporter substrate-binding domain-containing protein [Allorhizobium ampelinum]MVA45835.1 transporter substrate-binding domain-containing protein [Agrobacterium vitis]
MPEFDLDVVRAELAPAGTLTCALNHGNVVLVRRGPTDETPTGVSVDLARALSQELDVPIAFRHYDKAGAVSGSVGTGAWGVCFLAIDPQRAEHIAYSDPYVQIEGAFLVRKDGPAQTLPDVDRLQLRIGAVKGSAYELFLSRQGGAGQLTRFDNFSQAVAAFEEGALDGLAGVRQAMAQVAAKHPGSDVLAQPFMAIPQAVGVSVQHAAARACVADFVRRKKAEGFVRQSLDRSGHPDVVVPA